MSPVPILKVMVPLLSLACMVYVAVNEVGDVLATVAVFPFMVDVAFPRGSDDVKVTVMMSPALATVVDALLEEIVTAERVGDV